MIVFSMWTKLSSTTLRPSKDAVEESWALCEQCDEVEGPYRSKDEALQRGQEDHQCLSALTTPVDPPKARPAPLPAEALHSVRTRSQNGTEWWAWTAEQDQVLQTNDNSTAALLIGCTRDQADSRRRNLRLQQRRSRSQRMWTRQEDEIILNAENLPSVAAELNRSIPAIRNRRYRLRQRGVPIIDLRVYV